VNTNINIIRFTYTSEFVYSQFSLTKYTINPHKLIGIAMTHYTENCPHNLTVSTVGFTGSLVQILRQWMDRQRLMSRIQSERADLLSMSAAQLNDIGVDRSAANREANRSDIPASRSR
jgi:uncharacterized protein YjiS (DUF1127 family)